MMGCDWGAFFGAEIEMGLATGAVAVVGAFAYPLLYAAMRDLAVATLDITLCLAAI